MILGERLMLEKQGKKAMDLKKEKKRASEKGKVRVREGWTEVQIELGEKKGTFLGQLWLKWDFWLDLSKELENKIKWKLLRNTLKLSL